MTKDLIERFARGPELLVYATQGLTRDQETARPGPGAWSILELAVHLADSDLVGADRMKRLIAEDNPTLLAYDQDAWVARLHYHDVPMEEAVNLFVANRRWMTRLLRQLGPDDFARAGQHTERGRETLAQLVVGYANHLDYHLKFLYAKRGNLGVSLYPRYSAE